MLLLAVLPVQAVQAAEARRTFATENLVSGDSHTRAFSAVGGLSVAECERVMTTSRLHGITTEAAVNAGSASDGGSGGTTRRPAASKPAPEQRSTRLRWLPQSRTTAWLYDRVLAIAKQVNRDAGWRFKRLSFVTTMQVGTYSADDETPGHLHWHADQEWVDENSRAEANQIRIISLSVQLSAADDYQGGELQIGRWNASKRQGDALVFPSFEVHRVSEVTAGQRTSLVAWILSRDPEPASSTFWSGAIEAQEQTLATFARLRHVDEHCVIPLELELSTLMVLGNVMMRRGNWTRLLDLSASQIDLTEEIYGESGALDDVFPPEQTTYYVRLSLFVRVRRCSPNPTRGSSSAPRSCAMASQRGAWRSTRSCRDASPSKLAPAATVHRG